MSLIVLPNFCIVTGATLLPSLPLKEDVALAKI